MLQDSVIRIEGMGLTGCMIARCLEALHIPFIWTDPNSNFNAWQASTGCIYPSGDRLESEAYQTWGKWIAEANSPIAEAGNYHFAAKTPPHGAKTDFKRLADRLSVAAIPTYHLNVYEFVMGTRAYFFNYSNYYTKDVQAAKTIKTWKRRDYYLWGWSMLAPVTFGDEFEQEKRVCFYDQVHKYQLNYVYPAPSYPYYFLGTSTVTQKTPSVRDGAKDIERFIARMHPSIEVHWRQSQGMQQGWRPVSKSPSVVSEDVYELAGQSGNGVRLAPLYLKEILAWIGYDGELPNPLL